MCRRRVLPLAPIVITTLLLACGGGTDDEGDAVSGTSPTVVGSPTDGDPTAAGPADEPDERVEVEGVVVAEVEEPIMLLPRPDDQRVWIAERPGRVRTAILDDDGRFEIDEDPVLDITADTVARGEQGLLGMAFSSDGGTLFLSYTNLDGDSRVDSWRVSDGQVDESSRRTIFELEQPFPNHNGGHLALDPDGDLHLGLGDGGAADDPDNRAQDDDELFGKLVLLDPDGGPAEIRAKGLRNPWRFDFDTDGHLWIADVGQGDREEIDLLAPGDIDGANLGWSGWEGTRPHLDDAERRPPDPVAPVHDYDHDDGRCSITGGLAYRGAALPHLDATFLFADLCEGRVRAVTRPDDDGEVAVVELGVTVDQPFSFGRDTAGEPYVLSASGRIIALRPTS